jgi:hypothetical protein
MHTPTTPEELDAMMPLGAQRSTEVTKHIQPLIRDVRYEFKGYDRAVAAASRICHFLGMHDWGQQLATDHYVTRGSMYVIVYREPRFRFWHSRYHFQRWISIAHTNAGKTAVGDYVKGDTHDESAA